MPRTTKKEINTENKLNTDVIKDDNMEMGDIIKTIKMLQSQMNELQKKNQELEKEKIVADNLINSLQSEKSSDSNFDVNSDVMVISQTVGTLNLSTDGYGGGSVYTFNEFGEIQDIPFEDLKDICKNMKRFAQEGLFYIANEKAVEKLRLKRYYNRMISNEDMMKLFDKDATTIIELYKLATDLQKEQIIGLIEDKLSNGIEIDNNVLVKLGELSGHKLIN